MYKTIKQMGIEPVPVNRLNTNRALFLERMRELDRDFARQTKNLRSMTTRLGKKLGRPGRET